MGESESKGQMDGDWLCVEHVDGCLSGEFRVNDGGVLNHCRSMVWLLDIQQTLSAPRHERY